MIRKLLALSLVFIAALAISAVIASAAQAEPRFTAADYPMTLDGTPVEGEEHVFGLGGSEFRCEEAEFSGESAKASATVTLTPVYGSCVYSSFEATVNMNGCDYLLHAGKELEADRFHAALDLVCPKGKEISVTTASEKCHITIPEQSGLETIAIENDTAEEGKDDIALSLAVTGIDYTVENTGFPCSLIKGKFENGTYVGGETLEGTDEKGNSIDLDVGDVTALVTAEKYPATLDGAQVGAVEVSTNVGVFTCKAVQFTGEAKSELAEFTVSPVYSGCTAFGKAVPWTANGCDYKFHSLTETSKDNYTGFVALVCPEGKVAEFDFPACKIILPPRSSFGAIDITNKTGSPGDVSVQLTIIFHYKLEGILCAPPGKQVGVSIDPGGE
jgi:hypothetical protein